MKKRTLGHIILGTSIAAVMIILSAYYIFTILDNMVMSSNVRSTFEQIKTSIVSSDEDTDRILKQFGYDNTTKAKALSIILYQTPEAIKTMNSLEELRVTFDAEEILVTDGDGIIIAGTSAFTGSDIHDNEVFSQFVPALTDKTFSNVVDMQEGNTLVQYVCASRRDKDGVIIIKVNTKYMAQTMQYAGLASILSEDSMIQKGHVFIISQDKWTYISNSDKHLIGLSVQIPENSFERLADDEIGKFRITEDGTKKTVYYMNYEDKILGISISSEKLYSRRNYVVGSIVVASAILILVAFLCARNQFLIYENKAK